jgi:hypothetical protein
MLKETRTNYTAISLKEKEPSLLLPHTINFLLYNYDDDDEFRFTVGYARTNVIGSRTSFVIASVRSSIH